MRNRWLWLIAGTVILYMTSCGSKPASSSPTPASPEEGVQTMALEISSPAFAASQLIPSKYTCDGANISPPLLWRGVPERTQSFALVMDDPDAPSGFVHWVLYNIPASVDSLPEAVPKRDALEDGSLQGRNSANSIGYRGPCPPSGTHRYYFRLYALDVKLLRLSAGATKQQLLTAMQGHILAQAELMAPYARQ